jgi:predicted MFS family arabinose efflux permease
MLTSIILQRSIKDLPTLKNRWWIIVASICGLIVSNATINIFTFAVFLKPVTEDIGLSRGTLSLGLLLTTVINGIATPAVGILIDKRGCRKIMRRESHYLH